MTTSGATARWGWAGSVREFLDTTTPKLVASFVEHHILANAYEQPGASQFQAWEDSIRSLRKGLAGLPEEWTVVFEYELPRERGRRPDVVILGGGGIIVVEFKQDRRPLPEYVDQVQAYARDIANYHAASHDLRCLPVLVLTGAKHLLAEQGSVTVVSGDKLDEVLDLLRAKLSGGVIEANGWLRSRYAPLPSLIEAARSIFEHEELPQIKRAASARIPDTIATLVRIAEQAQTAGERHVALVTGVPGAGKTLVGLQFVYTTRFGDEASNSRPAVFLSGNGPLVKVLQHLLKSRIFVQDVHGFLKEHGGNSQEPPSEHIWVYDEAQRAWDAERVKEKRGHGYSEPEDFLRIGERLERWAMLVGLIGEGQEIHLGEEAGLKQWNDALEVVDANWIVHCPPRLASTFTAAERVVPEPLLELTVTMRYHAAADVALWVNDLLNGKLATAREYAQRLSTEGYHVYITRDLSRAKSYAVARYEGEPTKRFGLLASSKAKTLRPYGIRNDWSFTRNMREGPWFNDPPDQPSSCCSFRETATEFQCQGLELDFPIVCWGEDVQWKEGGWRTAASKRSSARDPRQLRMNSYRVLLSRGRDGQVIFVPPQAELDTTYDALIDAGAEELT